MVADEQRVLLDVCRRCDVDMIAGLLLAIILLQM
jgi:hypothetical protein